MSKKYFINNLDTDFGEALLQELVKEPTEDPLHMCTVRVPLQAKPNGVRKILKRDKPKLFRKKAIDECEVYVYNLNQTEISDIEFGVEMMSRPFEDNKVFILVSDIMAWSNSGRKEKKEKPPAEQEEVEEGEQKQPQEISNKQPSQQEKQDNEEEDQVVKSQQSSQKPKEYTFFEDSDYRMRVPLQSYAYVKEIEDKVLSVKKDNVKVYIVCPGMIYGCGEDTLYPLYKAAWLQEPRQLPYLGEGQNVVPMIHLHDLIKFVIKVAESPPEDTPYLLAFDESSDRTQKAIIDAISRGIGSGLTVSAESSSLIENPDRFLMTIDIQPSKFLVGTAEEPSDFEWTAREGISKNIEKTRLQFCSKHCLRPLKILMIQSNIDQRTESRIDRILQTFSDYYKIPLLEIKEILEQASSCADEGLKTDLGEEWTQVHHYLLEGEPRPLDETMKVFYRAVRWRLQQNDCINRGFILLNFPKLQPELEHIFLKLSKNKLKRRKPKPKTERKVQSEQPAHGQQEDEEVAEAPAGEENKEEEEKEEPEEEVQEEEEGDGPKCEQSFPESVISVRRAGEPSVEDVIQFFTSRGIEELIYDTTAAKEHKIFESLRTYIERNGRPNNYLTEEDELLQQHLNFTKGEDERCLASREQERRRKEKEAEDILHARNKIRDKVAEEVRTEGEEEIKKMPFRNYLMEFVVPTLNEGLLEVSNIIPNDPVDLLAEYLYQKSYDF